MGGEAPGWSTVMCSSLSLSPHCDSELFGEFIIKNQSIGSPHSGQGRPGSQAPGICPQFVHIEMISSPNMNWRIREHI
jgi:hypothetical protein